MIICETLENICYYLTFILLKYLHYFIFLRKILNAFHVKEAHLVEVISGGTVGFI